MEQLAEFVSQSFESKRKLSIANIVYKWQTTSNDFNNSNNTTHKNHNNLNEQLMSNKIKTANHVRYSKNNNADNNINDIEDNYISDHSIQSTEEKNLKINTKLKKDRYERGGVHGDKVNPSKSSINTNNDVNKVRDISSNENNNSNKTTNDYHGTFNKNIHTIKNTSYSFKSSSNNSKFDIDVIDNGDDKDDYDDDKSTNDEDDDDYYDGEHYLHDAIKKEIIGTTTLNNTDSNITNNDNSNSSCHFRNNYNNYIKNSKHISNNNNNNNNSYCSSDTQMNEKDCYKNLKQQFREVGERRKQYSIHHYRDACYKVSTFDDHSDGDDDDDDKNIDVDVDDKNAVQQNISTLNSNSRSSFVLDLVPQGGNYEENNTGRHNDHDKSDEKSGDRNHNVSSNDDNETRGIKCIVEASPGDQPVDIIANGELVDNDACEINKHLHCKNILLNTSVQEENEYEKTQVFESEADSNETEKQKLMRVLPQNNPTKRIDNDETHDANVEQQHVASRDQHPQPTNNKQETHDSEPTNAHKRKFIHHVLDVENLIGTKHASEFMTFAAFAFALESLFKKSMKTVSSLYFVKHFGF
ncbi:hypothetical protein HELRODRAFT_162353 [Helobdella robusta]|uniref:Uncharacterized protein n=1 Tax=Helobdella robusta TaxID=6412 RepID=T1ESJ7_HELRO|nr:hypothetical protein HELRODRAFT_162353 [Helobdella robusta]ESN98888.1 hypothetical protein HELRODRAFT_162353 [Helobdella robusta]